MLGGLVLFSVLAQGMPLAQLLRDAGEADVRGRAAPQAYVALAEAMEKADPRPPGYTQALERGLTVSIRDRDPERAAWFSARLNRGAAPVSSVPRPRAPRKDAWIPGGLQALSFVAKARTDSPRETFFADYCRAIILNTASSDQATARYLGGIRFHFRQLAQVEALGKRKENRVEVALSLKDDRSRSHTERVLKLLGWKLRSMQQAVVQADEKTELGRRQEVSSALAIDAVAAQQALESGATYNLEFVHEAAPVLLGEETWREQFYPKESYSGGLAEALAFHPRLAKLYAGLNPLDQRTISALIAGVGWKSLAEKFAAILYLYAPALAVVEDRAVVPGGRQAEPVWEQVVGAAPGDPPKFFRALLETDKGRLLAFFFHLSELDLDRQRFCTRSAARTRNLYEMFAATPELRAGATLRHTAFVEALREIPLDAEGKVRFPGGASAWAPGKTAESDDDVLFRLAGTKYVTPSLDIHTELDNLLAVMRLESHRRTPLDAKSARLLASQYPHAHGIYADLSTLTGLSSADYEAFFALEQKVRRFPQLDLNLVAGEFQSLVAWLGLAQRSGALEEAKAAELFHRLCDRFVQADSAAQYATAALEMARRILENTKSGSSTSSPDEAVRNLLLGLPSPVSFEWNGASRQVDPIQARHRSYQRVMELQRVPALGLLFEAAEAIRTGAAEKAEAVLARFPRVEVPKDARLSRAARKALESADPSRSHQRKNSEKLWAAVHPQVMLALAGTLYAYYLSPEDLVVAEDPLLLRKHQFILLDDRTRVPFEASRFEVSSRGTGSYLIGGFGGFARSAGQVAAAGGGKVEAVSAEFFGAQIAAIRATAWRDLRDEDLRLLSLRIKLAREWIVRAASDPPAMSALSEAVIGLLSLTRRSDLLAALEGKNWPEVWNLVTLSDLYYVSQRYQQRYVTDPWPSPVTEAFRAAIRDHNGAPMDQLGASLTAIRGCGHPHLVALGPYEEYERYLFPSKMAERTAELKLYLADLMGRAGLPVGALAALAEPLARTAMEGLRVGDIRDWSSVLAAFSKLGDQDIEDALRTL